MIAIVNFSPDTDHDAAEVTWGNGYTNVYRLGYRGRLDVVCVEPMKGTAYYKDHIPILSKLKFTFFFSKIYIWFFKQKCWVCLFFKEMGRCCDRRSINVFFETVGKKTVKWSEIDKCQHPQAVLLFVSFFKIAFIVLQDTWYIMPCCLLGKWEEDKCHFQYTATSSYNILFSSQLLRLNESYLFYIKIYSIYKQQKPSKLKH